LAQEHLRSPAHFYTVVKAGVATEYESSKL